MRLFVGGYSADAGGAATGIGVVHAGDGADALAGGQLSTGADAVSVDGSPSWLAWHPTLDVLYAAQESAGTVQAFRRTGEESFVPLGPAAPAGDAVCHVAVEPGGRWLLASCWGDGHLVRMPLDERGVPSSPVLAPAAVDPYASATDLDPRSGIPGGFSAPAPAAAGDDRPSRTHQAVFVPRSQVITIDLGLDHLRVWDVTTGAMPGRMRGRQSVVLPHGSGPRHAVWHPSGHLYVVTELSLEVFVVAPGADGVWRVVGSVPLSPQTQQGTDFAAGIELAADGQFVSVGVRGSDTIATLRVRGSGDQLQPEALTESGVAWPRHHLVARDNLYVAGQHSHDVVSLPLDARTGIPSRPRSRTAIASPSHLLPDR